MRFVFIISLLILRNVNGVNVIGLALQGPSVPSIAVLHHNGPYSIQQGADDNCEQSSNELAVVPLQPRPATTGNLDVLQLQPRLLPNYDRITRECRSEPKDVIGMRSFLQDLSAPKIDSEIGVASVPALAIGSSTEVLVSIIENQAGLRRNSYFSTSSVSNNQEERRSDKDREIIEIKEILKSPDDDEFVKSPSTETTNPSDYSSTTNFGISRDDDSRSTLDCENCVVNVTVDDCDKLCNRTC